jgi:hypothetical protein
MQMRGAARFLGACLLAIVACSPPPVTVPNPLPQTEPPQAEQSPPAPAVAEPPASESTPEPQPAAAPNAAAPEATTVPTQAAAPVQEDDPCERGSGQSMPAPGSPGAQDFFRSFRAPLAPAPQYAPAGQRHVGLQAGHWLNNEVPPELGRLQHGSSGGGKAEWEVNLEVAERAAALLDADGVKVDILPTTIPPRFRAHAFVSLHADGDPAGRARGFKIARPGFSSLPDVDDRLVETLNTAYEAATGLPRDDEHISLRMRYYYAFNSRRFCHAVAPGVPQAIVEMGYMTSAADRQLLIGDPERLARGVAEGVRAFLRTIP